MKPIQNILDTVHWVRVYFLYIVRYHGSLLPWNLVTRESLGSDSHHCLHTSSLFMSPKVIFRPRRVTLLLKDDFSGNCATPAWKKNLIFDSSLALEGKKASNSHQPALGCMALVPICRFWIAVCSLLAFPGKSLLEFLYSWSRSLSCSSKVSHFSSRDIAGITIRRV